MAIDEVDLGELELSFSGLAEPETEISETVLIQNPNQRHFRRKVLALAFTAISALFPYNDSPSSEQIQMLHTTAEPLRGDNLRVMTANVHGWEGQAGNNVDALLAALEEEQPDVACLQEVFADRGDELSQLYDAGYNVLFTKTQDYFLWGRFGNAVISRHPLKLDGVIDLPNPDTDNPRKALIFDVGTDQEPLRLAAVHLSVQAAESRLQTEVLVDNLPPKFQGICGDFNQGEAALRDGRLGSIIPSIWFHSKVEQTFLGTAKRGPIDWIFSPCDQSGPELPELVDIDSDHFALVEDIDLASCS